MDRKYMFCTLPPLIDNDILDFMDDDFTGFEADETEGKVTQ